MAKVPPPPQLTGPEWQSFNRWLLELTQILNDQGDIDPGSVAGLPALVIQTAQNTADIAALEGTTGGQGTEILTLQGEVNQLQTDFITLNGQVTTLTARAQVFNGAGAPGAGLGVVGDWYANVGGAAGARIYIKTGAAVWTPFPF